MQHHLHLAVIVVGCGVDLRNGLDRSGDDLLQHVLGAGNFAERVGGKLLNELWVVNADLVRVALVILVEWVHLLFNTSEKISCGCNFPRGRCFRKS